MSFGYIGDTSTSVKQQVKNKGILTTQESFELEQQGFLGGSLELIEQQTVSGVSSLIFSSIKETLYDVHFLEIIDFQPTTDNVDCELRFFESGTEESASVYKYAYQYGTSGGSTSEVRSHGETHLRATFNIGNQTNEKGNAYSYFSNLGSSSCYSYQSFQTTMTSETTALNYAFGNGILPQASTVDQIKLFVSSGAMSLTAKLYGLKEK